MNDYDLFYQDMLIQARGELSGNGYEELKQLKR